MSDWVIGSELVKTLLSGLAGVFVSGPDSGGVFGDCSGVCFHGHSWHLPHKLEWMSACLSKEVQFGKPEHEKSNIIYLSGGNSVRKDEYFSVGWRGDGNFFWFYCKKLYMAYQFNALSLYYTCTCTYMYVFYK